jgi:hypothetical protein
MNSRRVLDYLATRPGEEDTLEGITNWWLRSDKGRRAVEELEETLNMMLLEDELEKIHVKEDVVVYRVKKRLNA